VRVRIGLGWRMLRIGNEGIGEFFFGFVFPFALVFLWGVGLGDLNFESNANCEDFLVFSTQINESLMVRPWSKV